MNMRTCSHMFVKMRFVDNSVRWRCIYTNCQIIAPPCFTPVETAKAPYHWN